MSQESGQDRSLSTQILSVSGYMYWVDSSIIVFSPLVDHLTTYQSKPSASRLDYKINFPLLVSVVSSLELKLYLQKELNLLLTVFLKR